MALNPKQRRFVEEYLVDSNATAAARRAGYREPNTQGPRLLVNVGVAEAIRAAQQARSERVGMTADDVLRELAILGTSDPWHYRVDDEGNVTLAPGVHPSAIRAVASIRRKVRHRVDGTREYETEVRLWDKNSALEKAGKHLGLFREKLELTGKDGAPLLPDYDHLRTLPPDELVRLHRETLGLPPAHRNGAAGGG